jgi:uncharacterized protein YdhG (YjbR/CyaY superfamily)
MKGCPMTVDEFVAARVLPEFWDVVEAIRKTLKELAPDLQESVSYGVPAYKLKKILAIISPTKVDITLSFSHGREFEDKYDRLRGVGKVAKHIKFKKAQEVDKELIGYYLKQAIEIDAK